MVRRKGVAPDTPLRAGPRDFAPRLNRRTLRDVLSSDELFDTKRTCSDGTQEALRSRRSPTLEFWRLNQVQGRESAIEGD